MSGRRTTYPYNLIGGRKVIQAILHDLAQALGTVDIDTFLQVTNQCLCLTAMS